MKSSQYPFVPPFSQHDNMLGVSPPTIAANLDQLGMHQSVRPNIEVQTDRGNMQSHHGTPSPTTLSRKNSVLADQTTLSVPPSPSQQPQSVPEEEIIVSMVLNPETTDEADKELANKIKWDSYKQGFERAVLAGGMLTSLGVAVTSYLLTAKDASTKTEAVLAGLDSGFANFFLASVFALKALTCAKNWPSQTNAYKALSALGLFPSLLSMFSRWQVLADSIDGAGLGNSSPAAEFKGFLFGANLFYALATVFMSMIMLLHDRMYAESVHFYNRMISNKWDRPNYAPYYRLSEMLKIHEFDLRKVKLPINNLKLTNFESVADELRNNGIQFDRTRLQKVGHLGMLTLSSASVLLVTSIIPPLFAKKTEQGLDALSQIKGFQTVLSWLFGQGAWGQNNGLVVAGTIPAWALYSISAWILPQTMLKAARQIYAALNEKCLLPVLSVIATALILTLYQGVETVSGMGLAGLTRNITDTCSKMALPNATAANITGPFPCYGQAANDTFLATWLLLNLYKMVESVMTMATAAMISAGSIVNGCGGVALYFYIAAKQTAEMSFFTAFCICQGIFSASKANTANTDDIIDMAKLKAVLDKALIAKQFAGEGDDRKLILVPEKKDEAGKVVSEQIVLDPAAIMKAFPEKLSKYNLFSFGNSGGVQQPLLGLGSPRTYGKKRVSMTAGMDDEKSNHLVSLA